MRLQAARGENLPRRRLPNAYLPVTEESAMHRQSFKIAGLDNAENVRALANAIQDLPSIVHLEIEAQSGIADVEHGNFVSPEDILQAIADAGFSAEYTTH